jgi:ParB family chromosome partitioning protein
MALAGCFVSIGQDGTPFLDKGLVKPEDHKLLARLLRTDGSDGEPVKVKPKHAIPESLRRDLAAERLYVAQVAIAKHPAIALDLLAFQAASRMLGRHPVSDGPNVEFKRSRPGQAREPSAAERDLTVIRKALPTGWLKPTSEAARFEAFRSLPQEARLELLAHCVALTLQPKLGPAADDDATAYDAALAQTGCSVAGYWRPDKDGFLSRVTRDQLLAIGRDVFGEPWAQSHGSDKKGLLVDQLDRAFSDPDQSGRTPGQTLKLKRWLPQGMSFDIPEAPKPNKGKKARKAA